MKPIKEYLFGLVKRFDTKENAVAYAKQTGKTFIYVTDR